MQLPGSREKAEQGGGEPGLVEAGCALAWGGLVSRAGTLHRSARSRGDSAPRQRVGDMTPLRRSEEQDASPLKGFPAYPALSAARSCCCLQHTVSIWKKQCPCTAPPASEEFFQH